MKPGRLILFDRARCCSASLPDDSHFRKNMKNHHTTFRVANSEGIMADLNIEVKYSKITKGIHSRAQEYALFKT